MRLQRSETRTKRDTVTIAIFFVIYAVIFFSLGMISALGAAFWICSPPIVAFLTSPVIVILLAKIPRNGPMLLYSALFAAFMFLHGMTWIMAALSLAAGAAAEIALRLTGFTTPLARLAGCTAFGLIPFISLGALVFYRETFAERVRSEMGGEYADLFMAMASNEVLLVILVLTVAAAILGGMLGNRLVEKHFRRAGVV